MKVRLMLCAIGISIDRKSNNVTAFNILEEISAANFPAFIPEMYCLIVLDKTETPEEPPNFTLVAQLGDEELFKRDFAINFQDKKRHRYSIGLAGLVLNRPGNLEFRIYQSEKLITTYEIEIIKTGKVEAEVEDIS